MRATIDNEMQPIAAQALQRQLEDYDRGVGIWHGTGKTIPADQLTDEATWREALSAIRVSRDVDLDSTWYPAVVLSVGDSNARIGIEGVPETADGHFITPKTLNGRANA